MTQDKKTKLYIHPRSANVDGLRKEYFFVETEIKGPCFEVVAISELQKLREENEALKAALELINKEELNAQRPGGSYSKSAKISYDVLKKYPEEK